MSPPINIENHLTRPGIAFRMSTDNARNLYSLRWKCEFVETLSRKIRRRRVNRCNLAVVSTRCVYLRTIKCVDCTRDVTSVCLLVWCTCAPSAGIKQSRSHCNKYSSRKSFESLFEKYASIIFIPFSEAKFVFIDVEITIFFSLLCRKNEKYRIIIFYRGEKLIKWQFRIVQSYLSRVGCWVMNDRNGTRIEYNFKFIRQRIILRFAVLSFHCERRIDRI